MNNSDSRVSRIPWEDWKDYLREFSGGMPSVGLFSRLFINLEQIKLLEDNKQFNLDVKTIREKLQIPKLDSTKDQQDTDNPFDSLSESFWLRTKTYGWFKKFDKKLNLLINKYKLTMDFYEWLRWIIMYGYTNNASINIQYSSYESFHKIIENPDELKRIGLTTEEKRFYKFVIRKVLKIERRPNKEVALAYSQFLTALKNSKNTISKPRTNRDKQLIDSINKIGKIEAYDDPVKSSSEPLTIIKNTSLDAAYEIYEDEDDPMVLNSKAATLRKIIQRNKNRKVKLIGNN